MISSKKKLTILNYETNILEVVNSIKTYMTKNDCKNIDIDISKLNLIDASKLAILCSAYHFTKYPNGQIQWLVTNPELKKHIQPVVLKNTIVTVIEKTSTPEFEKQLSTSLVK